MKTSVLTLLSLCGLICLTAVALSAQNETRFWYTGYNAGLDFATDPPTPIYDGASISLESTSVMSDDCGDLLFYTNGYYVWNRLHQVMPGGEAIGGGCFLGSGEPIASATQGALIVPIPFKCDRYLVFTTGCADTQLEDGLRYSVVDMSKSEGLGEVVSKGTLLYDQAVEKLNAVFHENGEELWLISRKYETNAFYVYRIDSTGLQPTPVISSVGQPSDGSGQGYMQLSPNGERLVLVTAGRNPEFFTFDTATGQVEADFVLPDSLNIGYFSAAFSPSGKKIYFSSANWFNSIWSVDQYDLEAGAPADVYASRTVLKEFSQGVYKAFGGLQLGKDGVIYTTGGSFEENGLYIQYLDAITNPEANGLAAAYNSNYVGIISDIDSGIPGFTWGLPNFVVSYLASGFQSPTAQVNAAFEYELQDTCGLEPVLFYDLSTSFCEIKGWRWNFGDPASGASNFDTIPNPEHIFSAPGTYLVTLEIEAGCRNAVFTAPVTVGLSAFVSSDPIDDHVFCEGDSVTLSWDFDESQTLWSTGTVADSIQLGEAGIYWAELQLEACTFRDSFELAVQALPPNELPEMVNWCEGDQLLLSLPSSEYSYQIEGLPQEGALIFTEEGIFEVVISDGLCTNSATIEINADNCPDCQLYIPNAFSPNQDGFNDAFQVFSNCMPIRFQIQIFDRWGSLVFESQQSDQGWEGRINGQDAAIGTYTYFVKWEYLDRRVLQQEIRKGDLVLIR